MFKRSSVLTLLVLTIGTSICLAQSNPSNASSLSLRIPDRGFSSYTNLSQSYDSSSNWTSVIDSTVSYSFNRVFGISVGAPFYVAYNQPLFSNTATQTATQTAPVSGYNAMGDLRFGLRFATPTPVIKYVVTITGTAPTGDTSIGLSTGRFTGDFNNHLEFDLWHFSPLLELGLANTNTLLTAVKRPYTTLGMLSHYKAGLGIPLGKRLSFEFSGYENLPLGLQKLYSQEFNRGPGSFPTSRGNGKSQPIYEQAAAIIGNGFTEDNGFSTGLSADLGRRVDMGFTYDRSARQKLDTLEFSLGFRIGRAPAH